MAETSVPPPPPSTVSRPVSEALLNEKVGSLPPCPDSGQETGRLNKKLTRPILLKQWDRCLSNLLIKSSLGLGFGVVFSVLLFKRRAWPAIVGAGFGAGRAYEECNYSLKQAAREIRKQA